jgi:3-oxoacyl-[acyl-carrier-protein] synthase II
VSALSGSPPREVWVTGLGIACPLGLSPDAVAIAQRESRSGARPLASVFPPSGLEVSVCCPVADWGLSAALGPDLAAPLLGGADRKSEFGWYACVQALRDAFGDDAGARAAAEPDPSRFGVHLASGLVSTAHEEADADLMPVLSAGPPPAYDFGAAAVRLRQPGRFRGRHFSDRVNRLAAARYGFAGPSLVNHGACAASSVSVGLGARWIRRGSCDVVLAGGFESMIHPFGVLSFAVLGALSPRADCPPEQVSRPFDRSRDGFVIGEGAAVLVLEDAGRARARGARCWGRVLGMGSSLDAYRATAPPPDGRGAREAMRAALSDSRLTPDAIDYVNAHGTGTPLNDSAETAALHAVFGRGAGPPVSSSKSALGHAVAAAGAVEAALCLLALRDGILPPTLNLHDPDPDCDLDHVPLIPRERRVRTVLSNSFGFGGVNASLVLGAPP